MRSRTVLAAPFIGLALVVQFLLVSQQARAADPASVRIRQAIVDQNGHVRLIVSLDGAPQGTRLAAGDFAVTENGSAIPAVAAEPLASTVQLASVVALVIDVSGSTAGKPIADAKVAAQRFVSLLPANTRVGVFAFGEGVRQVQRFTEDRTAVGRAISGLAAGGGTALYDGVVFAAARLRPLAGQHDLVLFSDGKDTASKATLRDALVAARAADTPVTSVGLRTSDFDARALDTLSRGTRGRSLAVGASAQLAEAFGRVAEAIASQYVVSYDSRSTARELDLSLSVRLGQARAGDRILTVNARSMSPSAVAPRVPEPASPPRPLVPAFGTLTGFYVGLAGVFFALLLVFGVLFLRPNDGRAIRALRAIGLNGRHRAKERGETDRSFAAAALGKAGELIDKAPHGEGSWQRLQLQLDRAAWPFRASEFVGLQLAVALAGALLGFGLLGQWWLGIVFAGLGIVIPRKLLGRRVEKRSSKFVAQLPDTLDLLAGSLQAGYGFMQALDTLVKESPPPTSTEFSRVLTEARLGMPLEDALETMGERVDSDDLRWVILAINIQRQVGGNLAVLLKTVAGTLREREQVRRQIKVLSAEGRLSASILTVMPFLLAGYIMLVNPSYISKLFTDRLGQFMIAGALMQMGLGIAWMRKIIRIDV